MTHYSHCLQLCIMLYDESDHLRNSDLDIKKSLRDYATAIESSRGCISSLACSTWPSFASLAMTSTSISSRSLTSRCWDDSVLWSREGFCSRFWSSCIYARPTTRYTSATSIHYSIPVPDLCSSHIGQSKTSSCATHYNTASRHRHHRYSQQSLPRCRTRRQRLI